MGRQATHRLRVRYAECDPLGVVFNANYFLYFDVALTELWRQAGLSYAAMAAGGIELAVLEATARFHAAARFDDEIDVTSTVERLGRTSIVTGFRISRGDELLCEGRLVHVVVDKATLAKLEIPAGVRAALGGGGVGAGRRDGAPDQAGGPGAEDAAAPREDGQRRAHGGPSGPAPREDAPRRAHGGPAAAGP